MTSLFLFTVFAVAWSMTTATECTQDNLNKCNMKVSVRGQSSAVVPWYTKAVVNDICSRYEEFAQCLHDILPACQVSVKLVYQGLRDAYDFICNSGYDAYLQHQPCFADASLQNDAADCNRTLSQNLANLKHFNSTYGRDRLCQYSDAYVECVGNVVKHYCSLEAESWQNEYDAKSLCPVLATQGCIGWVTKCKTYGSSIIPSDSQQTDSPSWSIIVLSLSIALASLIIVVAVVVLACFFFCPACRRRRNRRRESRQSSQSAPERPSLRVDMPPPYPGPFIPCSTHDVVSPPDQPTTLDAPWLYDIAGADEAAGGADVVEKKMPMDDDDGHFVPDDVEMDAKLAAAIPPPPSLADDYQRRQRQHNSRQDHYQKQKQNFGQGAANDCFVPEARGIAVPKSSIAAGSSWQKMSPTRLESDSGASFNMSAGGSPSSGAGSNSGSMLPSSSTSSRPWSPASFYVPSTASSSLSFQSGHALIDETDPTQTDVDYY